MEENNGTVSNEKGIAVIGGTKSSELRISHLNYIYKNIMLSGLTEGTNTILVSPGCRHHFALLGRAQYTGSVFRAG